MINNFPYTKQLFFVIISHNLVLFVVYLYKVLPNLSYSLSKVGNTVLYESICHFRLSLEGKLRVLQVIFCITCPYIIKGVF